MQSHKCEQCLRDNKISIFASMQNKHIDCFKQACKNVDASDVCRYTILYGSVEFLKCAHENGYPWDPRTLEYAIAVRNIDCLKYAHEQKVPFKPNTCDVASMYNNMKCLRFSILAGAPTNHCFRALVIKTNLRLACLRIKKRRTQRLASIALKIFNRKNIPEIGKLVATHIINTSI